jgi:hypothetical protein
MKTLERQLSTMDTQRDFVIQTQEEFLQQHKNDKEMWADYALHTTFKKKMEEEAHTLQDDHPASPF